MADDADTIATQEQLSELLEGRTDAEINEFVDAMGVDVILGQIFTAMTERFQADKAGAQSAVIGWTLTATDGPHSYTVTVADGTCTAVPGEAEGARVTLALALPDFLRFIAGQLEGMQAFMSGKLKLSGDMMFAQQMQSWFAT